MATAPTFVAALDLGSNSFHMIVARLEGGHLHVVDKVRERVRLGAGLDDTRRLTPDAQKRALDCLERFGERLRALEASRVRAVGTNTLRQAKNGADFLTRAHKALGHPIEVIPGREEARLIYLGVQSSLPADGSQRLVVDIGGGSTELVVGRADDILRVDSLFMGCVSFSQRFFADGKLTDKRFRDAKLAAGVEIASVVRRYRDLGWDLSVGCSGTIHAVKKIARAQGWSNGDLTPQVLEHMERALVRAGRVDAIDLLGLPDDRRPILAGGLAILAALFEHLGVERMVPSAGALREGALYDLVGRIQHTDVRDATIRRLCVQYSVDMAQVERVERTALRLLHRSAKAWGLPVGLGARVLKWAAHLHEIGLTISHTGFHKHGGYVVRNADMPGFSRDDQVMTAAVIQAHRRGIKRGYFDEIPEELEGIVVRLAALFRLAVALHRGRAEEPPVDLELELEDKRTAVLRVPEPWLAARPLTRVDLEGHAEALRKVKLDIRIDTLA